MTPTYAVALIDAIREIALTLVGLCGAAILIVGACMVVYLASCAWAALRELR